MSSRKPWQKQAKKAYEQIAALKDIDREDVLDYVGLQDKPSVWSTAFSTVGIFVLGALVGAGLGLAFAPKPGAELRNDVSDRLRKRAEELPIGESQGFPNRWTAMSCASAPWNSPAASRCSHPRRCRFRSSTRATSSG